MSYKSLCVVITDWGDLRDQIFSRTGFAPSAAQVYVRLLSLHSVSRLLSHRPARILFPSRCLSYYYRY